MEHDILAEVLIILAAAVVLVPVSQRLGVGAVLGYLVAGTVIGPSGLALVETDKTIHQLAELGVVFLLFAIGLELKLQRLWVMRRFVLGLGSLQIVVTGAALTAVMVAVGLPAATAIVVGSGLALSSTAVVLQTLNDRGELNTRTGRVAFSVLLMQDIAVVPLLAMVPMLAGDAGVPTAVGMAALQATGVLALIVIAGRYLLRPVLKVIAATRSTEIFAATAVLVVLGTSWLTALVGLSMALGAFLAGLMLAETEFRHQVEADILPFRGFLLGLFFMTVGMSVDLRLLVSDWAGIIALTLLLLATKTGIIAALTRMFTLPRDTVWHSALLLAQGGEFGFVLFGFALTHGVLDPETSQILTLVVSLSMIATPLIAIAAERLAERLRTQDMPPGPTMQPGTDEMHDHVIIAGFGRVGQTIARMLESRHIPYIALDLHGDRVSEGLARGLPVFFADASRPDVLRLAGAAHARAAVITMDHPSRAERAVTVLRQSFPHLKVLARARDQQHSAALDRAGASVAVPETLEASLQLGAILLRSVGTTSHEVNALLDTFRANDYARLENLLPARRPEAETPPQDVGPA